MAKGSLLAIVIFLVASLSAQSSSKLPQGVGKEACTRCHQYERRTTAGTLHDNANSCQGCHGNGEQHLRSGGGSSTIFSYRRATAEEVRARCGHCHQNPAMKKHAQGDVACTSCHSSHHYGQKQYLLKPVDPDSKPA